MTALLLIIIFGLAGFFELALCMAAGRADSDRGWK